MLSCRCGGRRPVAPARAQAELPWKLVALGLAAALALTLVWARQRSKEPAPDSPGAIGGPVAPATPANKDLVDTLAADTPPLRLGEARDTPSLEDVIAGVLPAVVSILSTRGTGSGFFVDQRIVVTNLHVVGDDSDVRIKMSDGDVIEGRVERVSQEHDLALVRSRAPLSGHSGLSLTPVANVKVGQDVLVIGSPLGILDSSVSRGIVSAVRSTETTTLIQTDAAINPGNSGGPVIDRRGRVIGIATMKSAEGENLGFAVASDHARELLEGGGSRAARQGASPRTREPTELSDLTTGEHEVLLDEVFERYRGALDAVVQQIAMCPDLAPRLQDKRGDARYYEAGRLVLDYVKQRRIYARSRRYIPEWSGMACLQRSEEIVVKGYEAIAVYDEVYKSYLSKSARAGRSPRHARQLPEI